MTTPADFRTIIPNLRDRETLLLVRRLVEFQREWLDSQAAQLEEIQRALGEQERKLSGQEGGSGEQVQSE